MLPLERNIITKPESLTPPASWESFKPYLLAPREERPHPQSLPDSFIMGDLCMEIFKQDVPELNIEQYYQSIPASQQDALSVPYRILFSLDNGLKVSKRNMAYPKISSNNIVETHMPLPPTFPKNARIVGLMTGLARGISPLLTDTDATGFVYGKDVVRIITSPVDVSLYMSTAATPRSRNSTEAARIVTARVPGDILMTATECEQLGIVRYHARRGSSLFERSMDIHHITTLTMKRLYEAYPHTELQNYLLGIQTTHDIITQAQTRAIRIIEKAPEPLQRARLYLIENAQALGGGMALYSVLGQEENDALASWMNSTRPQDTLVRQAYMHLLEWVSSQYDIEASSLASLLDEERQAFFSDSQLQRGIHEE